MLGLTRGTVRLASHSERWLGLFERERDVICRAIGELIGGIEHIGSTAVPGLRAKPIIDIAVGVADLADVATIHAQLEVAGYIYRGDGGDNGGHLFVREAAPQFRTHHVHVVMHGGRQWVNYLLVRNHLRGSATARTEYAALKEQLAGRFPGNRGDYTAGKAEFIERLLGDACP